MDGGGRDRASPPQATAKPSKFAVYRNPALAAALAANSLVPSKLTLLSTFFFSSASAFAFLSFSSREDAFIDYLKLKNLSEETAYFLAKILQTAVALLFLGALFALFKAISLHISRNSGVLLSPSVGTKDQPTLSTRQLALLGIKPRANQVVSEPSKKPPKSKAHLTPSSDLLVPLHQTITSSNRSSRISTDKLISTGGSKGRPVGTPSKSPGSSSLYLVPGAVSPLPSSQHSPGPDSVVSSPWLSNRVSPMKDITSEEKLEQFLAEVDEKITESAGKLATPSPTIKGFGIASPNTVVSSANNSGTTRSTPLRSVRMSPGSQKFSTPPKKGEGDLPPPMSLEEAVEAFEHLGIYPEIELWHDRLRQWFSSVLLNPLLKKIESSHIQVMEGAAKLGVSITVCQVGEVSGTSTVSQIDRSKEWLPAYTLDEDGLLHQLRATLIQVLDAAMPKQPTANLQQPPLQNPLIPLMQECVDAITEHQRLQALLKGELIKCLLPQSSVRMDYVVERIRELAVGTCVKNYDFLGSGEVYDQMKKKWTPDVPTDSHLLLYLFCAFLEHPKWMLHVDPTSYTGAQSSKNPLFLGVLPPKERFPEKYVAAVSAVPSVLHPGACILVVGKQSPPVFALYWDKKLQFSLQGRTAMWDSILLLCHRINVGYGGIVRGMHLGSSALSLLPVFDTNNEN
ncbi:transmembrane protein 209 [Rhodamnia argentea]|uniref:Transmembrane protein 209 n=1 Tax=Rhodamnia argentea TaxID=178133 RepID=A0A8B8NVS0_9MYRT|nr:transmembrane protein 209 [Rhodamnia argentea]